jgi:hypothetical protein
MRPRSTLGCSAVGEKERERERERQRERKRLRKPNTNLTWNNNIKVALK